MHDLEPGEPTVREETHEWDKIDISSLDGTPREHRARSRLWRYGTISVLALVLVTVVIGSALRLPSTPASRQTASQPTVSPAPTAPWVPANPNVSVAASGNVVYAGTADGFAYALNAGNGRVIWRARLDGPCDRTPWLVNGVLYIVASRNSIGGGGGQSTLFALRASDGKNLWHYGSPYAYLPDPLVVNGVVYVASRVDLAALRASDGRLLWRFDSGPKENYDRPVVQDGVVYSNNKEYGAIVVAQRATDGHLLWSYKAQENNVNQPLVTNGMVYVSTGGNPGVPATVLALRASDGSLAWRQSFADSFLSLQEAHDGTLYLIASKILLPTTPTPTGQAGVAPAVASFGSLLNLTSGMAATHPHKEV